MDKYIKTCLSDALQSIQEIESYFEGQAKILQNIRRMAGHAEQWSVTLKLSVKPSIGF